MAYQFEDSGQMKDNSTSQSKSPDGSNLR